MISHILTNPQNLLKNWPYLFAALGAAFSACTGSPAVGSDDAAVGKDRADAGLGSELGGDGNLPPEGVDAATADPICDYPMINYELAWDDGSYPDCSGSAANRCEGPFVKFADRYFAYNVRRVVRPDLPEDQCYCLNQSDVASISKLDLTIYAEECVRPGCGYVASLDGIECLANLRELIMPGQHRVRFLEQDYVRHCDQLECDTCGGGPCRKLDLGPLSALPQLESVIIYGSDIASLEPFEHLSAIMTIEAWGNEITDIGPLVRNSNFNKGAILNINDNPIDCTEQAGNIATLRNRGVTVYTDCDDTSAADAGSAP